MLRKQIGFQLVTAQGVWNLRFATSESSTEKQKHEEVADGWMETTTVLLCFGHFEIKMVSQWVISPTKLAPQNRGLYNNSTDFGLK